MRRHGRGGRGHALAGAPATAPRYTCACSRCSPRAMLGKARVAAPGPPPRPSSSSSRARAAARRVRRARRSAARAATARRRARAPPRDRARERARGPPRVSARSGASAAPPSAHAHGDSAASAARARRRARARAPRAAAERLRGLQRGAEGDAARQRVEAGLARGRESGMPTIASAPSDSSAASARAPSAVARSANRTVGSVSSATVAALGTKSDPSSSAARRRLRIFGRTGLLAPESFSFCTNSACGRVLSWLSASVCASEEDHDVFRCCTTLRRQCRSKSDVTVVHFQGKSSGTFFRLNNREPGSSLVPHQIECAFARRSRSRSRSRRRPRWSWTTRRSLRATASRTSAIRCTRRDAVRDGDWPRAVTR